MVPRRGSSSNSQRAKLRRVHADAPATRTAARAPLRCRSARIEQHATCGGRRRGRVRDGALVRRRAPSRRRSVRRRGSRSRREDAGEQRLADALAGHRVGGARRRRRRTAPGPARERDVVDARRDRPRLVRRLGLGVGPSTSRMCGRSRRSGHSAFMSCTARPCRRAGCRSRRWRARRGAGTTTRSPGSRSGSNHTDSSRRGRGADVAEVLAERVPLAEVARLGGAERLAQRRPHAVGADRVAGLRRCRRRRRRARRGRLVRRRRSQRVPVEHLDAGGSRRGRRARRRGRPGGRPRRTGPGPRGAGSTTSRPDGERTTTSSTSCHDGDRRRVEAELPRAGAARRWSARRRSTCPAGSGPCRRARRRARRGRA